MSDETRKALAERILRRVAVMEMTPNSASEAAGLSRDYIRAIQDGKSKNPRIEHMIRLARVLRCRLEWLLTGAGPETDERAALSPREYAMLDRFSRLAPDKQEQVFRIAGTFEPDDTQPQDDKSEFVSTNQDKYRGVGS
ncbi:MAG: helix-turn-helix domain-containing protein [Alphaproteobacteria bacterium]